MPPKNLFASLPSYIHQTVLTEFLAWDLRLFSKLDIALGKANMGDIANFKVVMNMIIPRLPEFVLWLSSRAVNLTDLGVTIHSIPQITSVSHKPLPRVQSITFMDLGNEETPTSSDLGDFLTLFPSLTAVNCNNCNNTRWSSITDAFLIQFQVAGLKSLNVALCPDITATTVLSVLTPSTEELHCDVLNKTTLPLLNCPLLKRVNLYIESSADLLVVCGPHLEHLEVRRDTRYFNMANQHRELGMATVKLIAQRCPNLRIVRMVNEFQDTAVSAMAIFLRECPLIESIAVGHLEVVLTTRFGVRMCSVSSNSGEVVWFNALIDALDVPVWKVSLPYVYLHHKHLQRLADKHGGTLSFFKLKLEDAVTDAMWDQFAVKCSEITVLCMSMSEGLSNASYALLSKRFPKLSEIAIATKRITDADMGHLLDQFQQNGHRMTAFDLSGCKELTDATVLKIVALFPDLLLLGLYVTKVTEQLLLDLILTKQLRARQLTHMHSYWIEMKLIEANIIPRPIFNSFGRG